MLSGYGERKIKNLNMHYRYYLFVSILINTFSAVGQKEISTLVKDKEVGTILRSGQSISGVEYTFPDRIHDFQIDTINNYITFYLRGVSKNGKWLKSKGHVVRYNIEENEVLWFQKINFQSTSVEQYGGITLQTEGSKSYYLDNQTGEQLWEVKNSLIFADPIDKIGIGYKFQASQSKQNTLEGIDLSTGRPIWEREISRDYSWNDVFYLNDSTLLIAASGLHTLNIFNGKGWDYNTVTGKKDYTASAVGTGLGIAAGLLTGMYSISTGYNLVRDVASNIIVDSTAIYFASREHLVKLNKNGSIQWEKVLPRDLTSKSLIFKHEDELIMVNKGYAYMGYRQLEFGKPFIASYNLNSGEQNYFETITAEKKEIIKGLHLDGDTIILILKDQVLKYSLVDGNRINIQRFDTEPYGELKYFVGDQVFIQRDSTFYSLPNLDSTRHFLYTNSGKILILNSDLTLDREMETEEFYIQYFDWEGFQFVAKENQTYVIDENGKLIAEFTASLKSVYLNNKLYDAHENGFLQINLDDLKTPSAFKSE